MAERKSRARRLAADDLGLWRHATRDVAPLRGAAARTDDHEPAETPVTPARTPPVPPPPSRRAPPRDLQPGTVADLDRATAERLRRGALTIDARLDLHGLNQAEAHTALERFLTASAARGRRCVLVITGKGLRDGQRGVLREAVPRWLNEAPNRARLLAVMPAQPKHGGAGALYVLLKRKRDG